MELGRINLLVNMNNRLFNMINHYDSHEDQMVLVIQILDQYTILSWRLDLCINN